jgi:hypothetical protein
MIARIAKIFSMVVMLVLLTEARLGVCEGWSLPNPFSSEPKTSSKKAAAKAAKKEPSTLDKIGTGTKGFFDKTGETLGLKKPAKKKPQYAAAKSGALQNTKKTESKSWLGSVFQPEEPPKPKTVGEWMASGKRLDP